MHLLILSPDKELFNGTIKSVKVPAIGGQFEILAKHAPVVAALEKGNIRIITSKDEKSNVEINEGYVEVLDNEVVILVSSVQA